MLSGVSKSGSPTESEMTSRPAPSGRALSASTAIGRGGLYAGEGVGDEGHGKVPLLPWGFLRAHHNDVGRRGQPEKPRRERDGKFAGELCSLSPMGVSDARRSDVSAIAGHLVEKGLARRQTRFRKLSIAGRERAQAVDDGRRVARRRAGCPRTAPALPSRFANWRRARSTALLLFENAIFRRQCRRISYAITRLRLKRWPFPPIAPTCGRAELRGALGHLSPGPYDPNGSCPWPCPWTWFTRRPPTYVGARDHRPTAIAAPRYWF